MMNVAAAACFAALVLLVLLVQAAGRWRPALHARAVRVLVAYAVGASGAAGLLQRDAWPFAKWPMAGGRAATAAANTRLVAVDATGREQPIDARAWPPLGFDALTPWMHITFPRLPRAQQDAAAAHLLGVAEGARRRACAGALTPPLGPFTAPEFDLHPQVWRAGRVPQEPFVGLRVYRESWIQEERRRDPARVVRVLAYEYRAP